MLHFEDARAWEEWLAAHHRSEPEAWLLIAKKGHTREVATVSIEDALQVALCYGWIDSLRRAHDAGAYLQRYSPRGPRSLWSAANVERVGALAAAGRMAEAGLAEVAAAQADGRWEAAYAGQREAEVPVELVEALAGSARAAERFEAMGRTARYQVMLPVLKARTPEGRVAQAERAVRELLAEA
ncbi:YdeI/OmpD-associated family protein [Streptacidiphilus jiangxiensis]|uniref:Uncharacterized conserved protein YdeI, YjbR/CyaY-like superfamily, DUF1801 family n=1 Tax=Streptacidiphilus jiangxiensis TaxID=235985 RepID=A0A1H7W0N9_STRJI|nr:YdeI/OmpD-associated family protein [Streptacidiphilus jiangxiensis]SEM14608.1 Uncharacterized conserved protein YdeI, YjbR/CyaY-like superfamily, DUF1801 family [Streptacidiphilus jiangxiensis]